MHAVPGPWQAEENQDPEHRVTVCDGAGFTGPGFLTDGGGIWGFTGNVLHRILQETGWERPWDRGRAYRL